MRYLGGRVVGASKKKVRGSRKNKSGKMDYQ